MASVIKNVAIGLDQSVNCFVKLADGWGTPDEMLSARAWRLREQHPTLRKIIDWLVNSTRLGRAMRATSENPRVASLMGVKPDVVIASTFVIGAVLATIAGVMWASNYGTVQHTMGMLPGLKAFTAAVFGGIGNLAGAVVGGILLGLIEAIGSGYIGELTGGVLGSHYTDIFAFIVLIVMLTLRPSGLLGERVADRA